MLLKKVRSGSSFTYKYDDKGRIVEQNEIGTENYIKLSFSNGKMISERFYGIPDVENVYETKELTLDKLGRVIKVKSLEKIVTTSTPDKQVKKETPFFDFITYEYDSRGNIVRVVEKDFGDSEPRVEVMKYDNKINPYYVSFKKHLETNYYIDGFFSLDVDQNSGLI